MSGNNPPNRQEKPDPPKLAKIIVGGQKNAGEPGRTFGQKII
jgi:hypothetical protein